MNAVNLKGELTMASSTRQAIACIFFILAIVISARSQSGTEKRPGGAIFSGKVTLKGKGAPNIAVGLVIIDESKYSVPHRTLTDEQGNYRIRNVEPGKYQVMVVAPGFITTDGPFSNKTFLITKSETLENVDFTLVRGGVITGKVTDSEGRPLVEEYIYLYPVEAREGYSTRLPGMIRTDDRGVYRVFSLPPGKYKIAVGQDFDLRRSSYRRTFYPATTEVSEAKIIEVSEGGEATNVDISLPEPTVNYSAQGRIIDGDTGQPIANLTYGIRRYVADNYTSELSTGSVTNKDGEFKFDNLAPGKYAVYAQAAPDSDWRIDSVPFEVVDRDLTGLIVKTLRGGSAAGVVVLEGTQDKTIQEKLRQARVYAQVSTPNSVTSTQSSTINQDGSFRIGGLQPGSVYFGVLAERFYVVRVERAGIVQAHGIELREREQVSGLRVIVNYGNSTIHGVVKVDGNPVPEKGLVSVTYRRIGDLPGTISGSRDGARVDARGQFYIEKLLPGTYEVTAIYATAMNATFYRATQQVFVTNGAVANVTLTVDTSNPVRP